MKVIQLNIKKIRLVIKESYADTDITLLEYCNKVASKLFGATGTLLFIVNAISLFLFGEGAITFVLLFSLFMVVLTKMLIDRLIKKEDGRLNYIEVSLI